MKKAASPFVRFVRRHKFISFTVAIIVILASWWVIANIMQHPLGDKLVYLGKQDYGSLFGDSRPYSVYYYGTDMTVGEVERYFKNMTPEYPSESIGGYTQIWLKNSSTNQTADLYYYNAIPVDGYRSSKSHIIKLRSDDYTNLQPSP